MENFKLKKSQIALAVAGALSVSGASAADLFTTGAAPTNFTAVVSTNSVVKKAEPYFSSALAIGAGKKVQFSIATDTAATGGADTVQLWRVELDKDNLAVAAVKVSTPQAAATTATIAFAADDLTATAVQATTTKVVYLVEMIENGGNDAITSAEAANNVFGLIAAPTSATAGKLNFYKQAAFKAAGATGAALAAEIVTLANTSAASKVSFGAVATTIGTYDGPRPSKVAFDATNGNVKVQFPQSTGSGTGNTSTGITLTHAVGGAVVRATDNATTPVLSDVTTTGATFQLGTGTANVTYPLAAATDIVIGLGQKTVNSAAGADSKITSTLASFGSTANLVTDAAGNASPAFTAPIAMTSAAPAAAATGAKAIATSESTSLTATQLWTAPTTKVGAIDGDVVVAYRFQEQMDSAFFNALVTGKTLAAAAEPAGNDVATKVDAAADTTKAVTVTPAYLLGDKEIFSTDNGTTNNGLTVSGANLNITLSLAAMVSNALTTSVKKIEFGFNADGELVVTSDNWTTSDKVTIGFNNVASAGAEALKLTSKATFTAITGTIAATSINAGFASAAPTYLTADKDLDGSLDGYTIDAQGMVVSTLPTTTGLLIYGEQGLAPLYASTAALALDAAGLNSKVEVQLTNKVNEDWNGDSIGAGVANADDTAEYTNANFGTGVTDPKFDLFKAGVETGLTGKKLAAVATPITYDKIYRTTDGGKKPLVTGYGQDTGATVATDGAAPVITKAEYAKNTASTPSIDATGDGLDDNTKTEFGGATLSFSEAVVSLPGEDSDIYIDGKAWTLLNLDANLTGDPTDTLAGDNKSVALNNVPSTVSGKVVSLAYAGGTGAKDAAGNALVAKSALTVVTKVVNTLEMTKAEAKTGYVLGTPVDVLTLSFNQTDVAWDAAATAADKNGVFQVRAKVGVLQNDVGGAAEDYTFNVPSSGVTIGTGAQAGKITLTLADSAGKPIQLPANSSEVWVEYNVNNTGKLYSAAAKAALGTGYIVEAGVAFASDDADTQRVKLAGTTTNLTGLNLSKDKHNSGNFYTQTIYGSAKRGADNLANNSQVRVDVVRVGKSTTTATYANPGRVGDGSVEIKRVVDDKTGGATGSIQELALLNKAVTPADLQGLAKDNADIAAAKKAYDTANSTNSPDKAKLQVAYEELGIKLSNKWFASWTTGNSAVASPTLQAFVEVTTGAGGKGVGNSDATNNGNSSSASDNNDASTGRTATLVRKLANVVKNGTTTYEVSVNMATGAVTKVETTGGAADSAIQRGKIDLVTAVLGKAASDKPYYEVLDSTFGLVKDGKYQVVAAVPEAKLSQATAGLDPSIKPDEAFVLISALDPVDGLYYLINSAEKSFTSYTPYGADLKGAGTAVKRDVDLEKVAKVTASSGGWKLMGIPGTPDRVTAQEKAPFDLARLFITVSPTKGDVGTLWDLDQDSSDQAFTLLNNVPALAYQIGTVAKNGLGLLAGQGFAMNSVGSAIQTNNTSVDQTSAAADDVDLVSDTTTGVAANLFVPLKTKDVVDSVEVVKGWSMVALQAKETLAAFIARNAGLNAIVIPDATGAVTWFRETGITPDLELVKGGAAFVFASPVAPATKVTVDLKP